MTASPPAALPKTQSTPLLRTDFSENNLSIANMDFYEFADSAGEDGIFRGF